MGLQEEIDRARADIRTDEYSMSIGELINIYEDKEIDIHPEFQRFFRWTDYQKTRLIESILLGIPIPPIFVSQQENGVWDVVDGLQRLSTIYQFVGILRKEDGRLEEPLELNETRYLPSLRNKKWEDDSNPDSSFTRDQRLLLKRAKIGISIILKESTEMSKFELFQRLNTGGSALSPQEVRNSILVMMKPDIYRWIRELSLDENFKQCTSLTDRALSEQYDLDLVLRFLIFRMMPVSELRTIGDVNDFLSNKMVEFIDNDLFDIERETNAFEATFHILNETLNSDSFHRYDRETDRFVGGFLVSAYELIALGIGYNIDAIRGKPIDIREIVKALWIEGNFTSNSGSGVRASSRIPITVPLGRSRFVP